jgi:hypothetical protein
MKYFKQDSIAKILLFSLLAFAMGCEEFIDDSFDTFTGVIVDEEGQPIPGLELIFTQDFNFSDFQNPKSNSSIYIDQTNDLGEFRFVAPSRQRDNFYYLEIQSPYLLEIDFFGEPQIQNYLLINSSEKDENGVVALGFLKAIKP